MENREMAEGVKEETGGCRFCGQSHMFHNVSLTPEELDEAATEACSCYEAREYLKKKRRAGKLRKEICRIFESEEKCKDLLCGAIPLLIEGEVDSIKVKTGSGVEAVLKVGSKGEIKAERKYTVKNSTEG